MDSPRTSFVREKTTLSVCGALFDPRKSAVSLLHPTTSGIDATLYFRADVSCQAAYPLDECKSDGTLPGWLGDNLLTPKFTAELYDLPPIGIVNRWDPGINVPEYCRRVTMNLQESTHS